MLEHFDSPGWLLEGAIKFAESFKKQRWIFSENKQRLYKGIFDLMDTDDIACIKQLAKTMCK